MRVGEIYERQVQRLSIAERIDLARLIIDDLAETSSLWVVDVSDWWSEDDLHDVTRASLLYWGRVLPGGDEDAGSR